MAHLVIGAGVVGLHIAYYLQQAGEEVVIIDKDNADNNCSFGNAGYISPSHFIPLATPGIVWQGLKWMMDSTSPFYIKPRFNGNLIKWAYHFYKCASSKTVNENAPHLYNLLKLSRSLTIDLHAQLGQSFDLWLDGCLMLYTQKETERHEKELAYLAEKEYGMNVPILDFNMLQKMDGLISKNVIGATYYELDCHLHPRQMMERLKANLLSKGVQFCLQEDVLEFEKSGQKVSYVISQNRRIAVNNLIIAAGSWSSLLSEKLGISLLLEAGKGYSYTYKNQENNIKYPSILVDHRVAMTPFGKDLRVGGTMELGGLNLKISSKRIPPIIDATNHYFDQLNLPIPSMDEVWAGLRPVSPDGLPYIGKDDHHDNVFVACGHAMIGISSAAATGHLLTQMILGQKTDIEMNAFRVNRF
ncbi:MAG: FAD-dependent oxidoreductase [Saprospiraceae bacterium]